MSEREREKERAKELARAFREANQDLLPFSETGPGNFFHGDADFLLDIDENERDMKNSQRHMYLQEIDQLKKEIAVLEGMLEDQSDSNHIGNTQSVLNHLLQLNTEAFFASTKANSQPAVEEKKNFSIPFIAKFTGIQFREVNINSLPSSQTGEDSLVQYELFGQCDEIFFNVVFLADETTHLILSIKTQVSIEAKTELSAMIEIVEREKLLPIFFKGLAKYASLRRVRQKIFDQLKASYPSCVEFDHSFHSPTTLLIHPQNDPMHPLTFLFVFEITSTDAGFVKPLVRLVLKYPQFAGIPTSFRASLNENFHALAGKKGLKSALEIFIREIFWL